MPDKGYGTAATPDGRWLLVALSGAGEIAVVDLRAMQVVRTLEVPGAPQEVLIRPDGAVAYVSCSASNEVAVIELKDWALKRPIAAGAGADGLAWAARRN